MGDTDAIKVLFDVARRAQAQAYAPYSSFTVGAAICCEDGSIHASCNVENAAYPVGTCAEAGAIAGMVAAGQRKIGDIAIIGSGDKPCFPCGACRQRIFEFSDAATRIHVLGNGSIVSLTVADLLPHAFGPQSLG